MTNPCPIDPRISILSKLCVRRMQSLTDDVSLVDKRAKTIPTVCLGRQGGVRISAWTGWDLTHVEALTYIDSIGIAFHRLKEARGLRIG